MSSLSISHSVTETSVELTGFLVVDWGGTDLYVKYLIREGSYSAVTENTADDIVDSNPITLVGGGSSNPAEGSVDSVTFYGLSAGTTYTVTGKIYNNSDAYTGIETTITITTTSAVVEYDPAISISLYDFDENYIIVYFNITAGAAGTYSFDYGVAETGESRVSGAVSLSAGQSYTTSTAQFSGLDPGTAYTFWCSLYQDGSSTGVWDQKIYETKASASSFAVDENSITYNSATVYAYNLPTNEGLYVRFFIKETDTDTQIDNVVTSITSSTMEYTFTGLSPSTQYSYNVGISPYASGASTTWIISGGDTFETTALSVVAWDWNISNGPQYSATATQTRQAYTAITNQGQVSDFSYLVWNDMVYKANEIIESRGGSWVTTYGTLSQTLMTSSDKVMTAQRYNAIWWNLAQYISTGLTQKAKGDEMLGAHFVDLATAINNTIWTG